MLKFKVKYRSKQLEAKDTHPEITFLSLATTHVCIPPPLLVPLLLSPQEIIIRFSTNCLLNYAIQYIMQISQCGIFLHRLPLTPQFSNRS